MQAIEIDVGKSREGCRNDCATCSCKSESPKVSPALVAPPQNNVMSNGLLSDVMKSSRDAPMRPGAMNFMNVQSRGFRC